MNRWWVVICLTFALAFLALASLLRPVGDAARRVTLPVVRVLAQTSEALTGRTKGGADPRDQKIQDLEKRLTTLSVDAVKFQALEEENRSLRAQAKFLTTSGYDSVGARVISRDLKAQRSLLLIDRGLKDGVEVGEAVITDTGIFIGKISLIKDRVATVQVITDPDSRVAAALLDGKSLAGVVEGRGNGAAALTYIPSSESVHRDQIVMTAGTEEKVPTHLPLGIINEVQGKPTDPFQTAAIEPLVRMDQVSLVSILRPTALRPSL